MHVVTNENILICISQIHRYINVAIKMATLEDLPDEVLEKILQHLDYRDAHRAGQCCSRLLALCDPLWKRGKAQEIQQTWDRCNSTIECLNFDIDIHSIRKRCLK